MKWERKNGEEGNEREGGMGEKEWASVSRQNVSGKMECRFEMKRYLTDILNNILTPPSKSWRYLIAYKSNFLYTSQFIFQFR